MLGFFRFILLMSFISLILVLVIGVFSDGQFILGCVVLILIPLLIKAIRI